MTWQDQKKLQNWTNEKKIWKLQVCIIRKLNCTLKSRKTEKFVETLSSYSTLKAFGKILRHKTTHI